MKKDTIKDIMGIIALIGVLIPEPITSLLGLIFLAYYLLDVLVLRRL